MSIGTTRDRTAPPPRNRGWLARAIGTSLALACGRVGAEPARTDGAYGRLEGDLTLALEAGVVELFPGELVGGRLTSSYLHTVGLYAGYADALGLGRPPLERSTAAGIELRPLFLPRFTGDLERGPAALDLWLDSFALALGLYGTAVGDSSCVAAGLDCWTTGVELGLGMELPLLGRADGPFVAARGVARWPVAHTPEASSPVDEPHGAASLSIGYRIQIDSALVAAADVR